MEKLKEYLKQAKTNEWTIDIGDLAERFQLSLEQVKQCIRQFYL